MRKLLSAVHVAVFLAALTPTPAAAFDWNVPWDQKNRDRRIERDEHGGYSETQRDYKARQERAEDEKEGEGYYNGEYHIKGKKHRKGEWQFID